MKLFILSLKKYNIVELPERIEDSLIVPYRVDGESNNHVITIEAQDNKWILKSNGSINVMN